MSTKLAEFFLGFTVNWLSHPIWRFGIIGATKMYFSPDLLILLSEILVEINLFIFSHITVDEVAKLFLHRFVLC